MHKNFLLSFLCFVSICFNCEGSLPSYNSHIIFIFGTSCAGKSSLSKQLQQELGSQWKLIDRDGIIEVRQQTYLQVHPDISNETRQKKFEEIERYADEDVLIAIQHSIRNQYHVIVDTQSHQYLREKLKDHHFLLSVLVYAPLHLLLERDNIRNQHLNRSVRRQFYARAFIFETFAQLYRLEPLHFHSRPVDRINTGEWNKDILRYCLHPETQLFFDKICQSNENVTLWSHEPCDVIINSEHQSIEEAVQHLVSSFSL